MSAPSAQPDHEKLAELRSRVDKYVFSRDTLDALDFVFDARNRLRGKTREVGDVFAQNLIAVVTTASSTWVFARRTAMTAAYYGLMGVEIGLRKVYDPALDHAEVQKRLHETLQEGKWKETLEKTAANLAIGNLADFLEDEIGRNCATNVLLQCAVMTWSVLEILTADLFVALLNQNPKMTATLFANEHTKKLYSPKEIALSLEEYSYDLSNKMGDVLIGLCRMDDLVKMRAIYEALLKNDMIRRQLNTVELWRLFKSRNLIVHRAAVVDELFRNSTGLDVKVGDALRITPAQLEEYIVIVGHAGVEILRGAEQFFPPDNGGTTSV